MENRKNIIFIISGLLILTIGLPLVIHSNLGIDPLSCLIDSLSNLTYNTETLKVFISYGTMLSIVNALFLSFHFYRNRNLKFIVIGMLMSLTLGGGIDLINLFIDIIPNTEFYQRLILFVLGFLAMGTGIAFIQVGKIQKLPFEGFQEAVSGIVKKDINVVRVYVEIALMILAVLVYLIVINFVNNDFNIFNTVYFGSIVIMLLTGPLVNLIYKTIKKGEKEDE